MSILTKALSIVLEIGPRKIIRAIRGKPMNPKTNVVRQIVTGVAGLLAIFGVVPQDVHAYVEAHATEVVGAVLTLWSAVAFLRNRGDARVSEDQTD